jgi:flagellar protein FlbD
MITLNRLGHSDEPFQLNTDMIVTVESTPDTVITLATGAKVVVAETPEQVAAAVHSYRADVLAEAFRRRGAAQRTSVPAPIHRGELAQEPPRLSAVEDGPTLP